MFLAALQRSRKKRIENGSESARERNCDRERETGTGRERLGGGGGGGEGEREGERGDGAATCSQYIVAALVLTKVYLSRPRYRSTSLIRKRAPLEPYSMTMTRAL